MHGADARGGRQIKVLWVLGSDTVDPAVPRTNGVEVLFSRMAGLFDPERFAVSVAYPDHGPVVGQLDAAGLRRFAFLARRNWDPRIMADVERMIRATAADVVHSNSGPLDLHVALAARLHGAHHVTTRHVAYREREVAPWRRSAYEMIDRACVRLGTHFVAISEHGRRVLVEGQGTPPDRVSVIYNGCRVPPPATLLDRGVARERLGLRGGALLLGMVARLEPHKGGATLLRAAAPLLLEHPGLTIVFAGTGPEVPVLEDLARRVGLGAAVRFLGFVRDVGTLYDALDYLVLPSHGAEGVPNVLAEALAHGCPCVATRVGGVADVVVDGECGWLVDPEDEAGLRAALREALDHPERRDRLGAAGRSRVERRFSLEAMVQAYGDLYRALARGGPAA
ncbi:MAG: glycosyltransferase family 4 protein [Deltaproteobacteria bacterium]|nr:glycosyltransferase family 4 protein [Deltaproteobacteria bacterium]